MPHTGQKAPFDGRYKPNCNGPVITTKAGNTLPPCDHCHREVEWTYLGP